MKTLHLLTCLALLPCIGFSQMGAGIKNSHLNRLKENAAGVFASNSAANKNSPVTTRNDNSQTREIKSNWFNYVNAYKDFYSSSSTWYYLEIAEDSSALQKYSNGYFGVLFAGIAQTYDLKSDIISEYFNNEYNYKYSINHNISLDSLFIKIRYQQVDSNITDTLVLRMVQGSKNNGIGWAKYGPHLTGEDTIYFPDLLFDTTGKTIVGFENNEIKIELDSTFIKKTPTDEHGYQYLRIKTDWEISPQDNGVFTVDLTYKAGGHASSGIDTLGENVNHLQFTALELEGQKTHPQMLDKDLTMVSTLDKYVLHNKSNWWYGRYRAGISLMSKKDNPSWHAEALNLGLKLSQEDVTSIPENLVLGMVGQNHPNPVESLTTIEYRLKESANVEVKVTDLLGKEVLFHQLGRQNTGLHKTEIDLSELMSGVYNYTLSANGESQTKKLIVSK